MAIIITGCSAIGKTTLAKRLLELFPQLKLIASTVTREKREDDINYRFVSNDVFNNMLENDWFMDSNQVFSNCWYGTLKVDFDEVVAQGYIPLIVTDMKGAKNFRSKLTDKSTCVINLMPIDLDSAKDRIKERRKDHIQERIDSLKWEVKNVPGFYNFRITMVNDCIEDVVKIVGRKIRMSKERSNEYIYGNYCYNKYSISTNPYTNPGEEEKFKKWDLGYNDAIQEGEDAVNFYETMLSSMNLPVEDWLNFFKTLEEERKTIR